MEGKRYIQPPENQVRPPLYFRNIPYLHPKHPGLTSALPEAASHFFSPWLLPSHLLSWLLPIQPSAAARLAPSLLGQTLLPQVICTYNSPCLELPQRFTPSLHALVRAYALRLRVCV